MGLQMHAGGGVDWQHGQLWHHAHAGLEGPWHHANHVVCLRCHPLADWLRQGGLHKDNVPIKLSFNEVLNLCRRLDLKKSKIFFLQHILACDDVSSNKVQWQKDLKFRRCCPAKCQLKFLPFTVTFTLNRTHWKLWLMMIYH